MLWARLGLTSCTTAIACAGLLGYEWTEEVRLRPSDDPRVIIVDTKFARISCPLSDALAFAEAPRPLVPIDRKRAERDPESWRRLWREYAAQLRGRFDEAATYAPRRPSEVKDFLHAGSCAVTDKRTGVEQEAITVVVYHNPERRGGGSRTFRFVNGPAFLGDIDWLP